MKKKLLKRFKVLLVLTVLLTTGVFLSETVFTKFTPIVRRNGYGKGAKVEEYEVSIEGVNGKLPIQIEVHEREYIGEEVQVLFKKVMDKLDQVILGENESFDRIEKDLYLVSAIADYPVDILWELDSYDVINIDGKIRDVEIPEDGVLVELRGTISYQQETAIYIRSARVYPVTRVGVEQILYDLQKEIEEKEKSSRGNTSFSLPEKVGERRLTWSQNKEVLWPYVLVLGLTLSGYLVYREREKERKEMKQRQEELKRDYPGIISKLTMLLGTGITLRNAWERIVEHYEMQKEKIGTHTAYEEMRATVNEMKSGISEAEAYEHFGKRCGESSYIKLGTLLSQNLRKGTKGISDVLRMEAIQAFENRKSRAKRKGEEAGAKLMMPMIGMLVVVFAMIMVPAFLTLQI